MDVFSRFHSFQFVFFFHVVVVFVCVYSVLCVHETDILLLHSVHTKLNVAEQYDYTVWKKNRKYLQLNDNSGTGTHKQIHKTENAGSVLQFSFCLPMQFLLLLIDSNNNKNTEYFGWKNSILETILQNWNKLNCQLSFFIEKKNDFYSIRSIFQNLLTIHGKLNDILPFFSSNIDFLASHTPHSIFVRCDFTHCFHFVSIWIHYNISYGYNCYWVFSVFMAILTVAHCYYY